MAYDRKQGQHHVAQSGRPDYRVEVGRAAVPVGVARTFVILDGARAAILKAWTSTLIPATGRRPDAAGVGAAEYIDATVHMVPSLRPALIHGIDELDRLAHALSGTGFTANSAAEQEQLLRKFQATDDTDAFSMVNDFTYEAYYGHPDVLAAMEAENGWRGMGPMTGGEMAPFDPSLLDRVRKLPPRYRVVEAEKGVTR
ncbi:MAG TPA: gluconate 2-dehydrogenase subunit 3 family protein [Candidatus Nitrosopolaris sp.]|nr:gluconate 2-dehydrogenase subunit 3 family protein [Candidatus Nitrosopolaris sp.]